jgi:hypothetical protein
MEIPGILMENLLLGIKAGFRAEFWGMPFMKYKVASY